MMRNRIAIGSLAIFCLCLIPVLAVAHPLSGPGSGVMQGFAHPFTGLDHILAMVAVGLFAVTIGGNALWMVPLTFMTLMAIGGWLGFANVVLPYVEAVVALSVLVLGLAIAIPKQWTVPAAMLLVGAFAVFHGHSHMR